MLHVLVPGSSYSCYAIRVHSGYSSSSSSSSCSCCSILLPLATVQHQPTQIIILLQMGSQAVSVAPVSSSYRRCSQLPVLRVQCMQRST
jgi:hypothetical protein